MQQHSPVLRVRSGPLMGGKERDAEEPLPKEHVVGVHEDSPASGSGGGPPHLNTFSMSQEEKLMEARVTRKLHWHIMSRFCVLTVLNNLDRANLAYASVQMNADLHYGDAVYGLGSGIFFAGYMIFQIPSQWIAEKVGFSRWIGFLMLGWGATATSMIALNGAPGQLYAIRFLLGMFEAGTFPTMWAHLTRFYAGGPGLAAAWGFIGAAQPLAQVVGAPLAAGLLLTDGAAGLHGWQWLFLVEGVPTIVVGLWIWLTLAPNPEQAKFLSLEERQWVARNVQRNKERMAADTGAQSWLYGIKCWKVYAQGFGSGWAGIMRYGAQYWTPLIVYFILNGTPSAAGASAQQIKNGGALAALLSGVPYTWAAIVTLLNSWHAKRTGEMYFHLLGALSIGAVALAVLTPVLGHNAYVAFFALILAATSQASNPLEWGYPATYLHGRALSSGWAVANCVANYGGLLGPWMIGTLKAKYGGYTIPMIFMTCVNSLAVVYFALLLRFLPIKSGDPAALKKAAEAKAVKEEEERQPVAKKDEEVSPQSSDMEDNNYLLRQHDSARSTAGGHAARVQRAGAAAGS